MNVINNAVPEQITLSRNVRLTQSEDGAALLDIQQGQCFSLNPMGLRIWELLRDGTPMRALVEQISQECSVPIPELEQDVLEFIRQLQENHLVEQVTPETTKRNTLLSFITQWWRR